MATAFAVFCATDGSLTFYNRDTVPSVGSTFEGKVVSNVYTGFGTTYSSEYTKIPWYNERANIISVSFMSEFATAKIVYTNNWFYGFSNMTICNLENLNTSSVIDMDYMFRDCSSLINLDLSRFNTSSVTSMTYMFNGCSSLVNLNLSSFNTSSVTDMTNMFQSCSSLVNLDLSSFNTSNVTKMERVFMLCEALQTIYVSYLWSTLAVTSSVNMFFNCYSLVGAVPFDGTKRDASMANYETGYFTYKRYIKPEDLLIKNTTLYDIADKIRILNGSEEDMTPAEMVNALDNISIGVELPTLSKPASAGDIAYGYEAITSDGEKITGTVMSAESGSTVEFSFKGPFEDEPLLDMPRFYLNASVGVDQLLRSGSNIRHSVFCAAMGDATAADVAAGKTFTSAAGFKVTGEASAGAEYEIVEWGKYDSKCSYSLSRVTHAVGGLMGSVSTSPSGKFVSVIDRTIYQSNSSVGADNFLTFSGGTITPKYSWTPESNMRILLINDPAATAIST